MLFDIPLKKYTNTEFSASGNTRYLSGEIDDLQPGFFKKAAAQMNSGEAVVLDVTSLSFINSFGVKFLALFLMNRPMPSKVIIETNHSFRWQKQTFEVFLSFDDAIIIH